MKSSEKATESSYTILKTEIEEAFGKKISSYGDCLLLSEEVYDRISITVSSNTLRRLLGLVKADHVHDHYKGSYIDILYHQVGRSIFLCQLL